MRNNSIESCEVIKSNKALNNRYGYRMIFIVSCKYWFKNFRNLLFHVYTGLKFSGIE